MGAGRPEGRVTSQISELVLNSARITGGDGGISPALQGVVPSTSYGHIISARHGVIPGTYSELIMINTWQADVPLIF